MLTDSATFALTRAEWTKWNSTRTTLTYGATAVGLSIVITALLGLLMNQAHAACARPEATCSLTPIVAPNTIVTAGLLGDGTPGAGLIALMLLGAATVLVEYRYGTLGTTFLATPRRGSVLAVKAGLTAIVAFILATIAAVVSGAVFVLVGGGAAQGIDPWSIETLNISIRSGAMIAMAAAAAVGLAAIIRNTIVVVTIIVIWPLVLEPLLPSFIPVSGATVAGFLPFINARYFIGLGNADADILWTPDIAGVYFAAWMITLLLAGTLVTKRATIR